jgi:hypothetical protein
MSGTVSPAWFRRASWTARDMLAQRRLAELAAAAAEHYARYPASGGESALLLVDPPEPVRDRCGRFTQRAS